jgi:hypothetical protein
MSRSSIICAICVTLGVLAAQASNAAAAWVEPAESYPVKIEATGESVSLVGEHDTVRCSKATFTGELKEASSRAVVTPAYKECSVTVLGIKLSAKATVKGCEDELPEPSAITGAKETREAEGDLRIVGKECETIFEVEADKCDVSIGDQGPLSGLTYLDTEKEGKAGIEIKAAIKNVSYKTNSSCTGETGESHTKGEYDLTASAQKVQWDPPLFYIPFSGVGSEVGFGTQGKGVQTFTLKKESPAISIVCENPTLWSVPMRTRWSSNLLLQSTFEAAKCEFKREAASYKVGEIKQGGCYFEFANITGISPNHKGTWGIVPSGCKLEFKLETSACVATFAASGPYRGVEFFNTKLGNPTEMTTTIEVEDIPFTTTATCENTYLMPLAGNAKYRAGLINAAIVIWP